MDNMFINLAKDFENDIISWREHIHKNPEIGMNVTKTSNFIQSQLQEMNIPYTVGCNGSSVTALIGDSTSKKCVLLRSDIDALPIKEETDIDFKSINDYMHACGHDAHAAILLGAAKLLKDKENELCGCVKLMFQPGEEVFLGAKKMIEEGVLENPKVDIALGMHVASIAPVGLIGYGKNIMSSCYSFKIIIKGKGGHGSVPENCIDPINAGVHTHLALQELISRECPSSELATLTIGQFKAGEASNIIPDEAILQGTLRTVSNKVRDMLVSRINEVVYGVALTYRCTSHIEVLADVPVLSCDDELNKTCLSYITDLDSSINFLEIESNMGSEDFACISQKVPSCYLLLGAGVDDQSSWCVSHNPKVLFNNKCLSIGSAVFAQCAYNWLKDHQ